MLKGKIMKENDRRKRNRKVGLVMEGITYKEIMGEGRL